MSIVGCHFSYLQLDLGLRDVLLAPTAIGDLLGLSNLRPDGLGAEVLQGVALDRIDAQNRVGLDGSKAAGHYKTAHIV